MVKPEVLYSCLPLLFSSNHSWRVFSFEEHSSAFRTNDAVGGVVERLTNSRMKDWLHLRLCCDPFYFEVGAPGVHCDCPSVPCTCPFRLWSGGVGGSWASGLPRAWNGLEVCPQRSRLYGVLLRECQILVQFTVRCTLRKVHDQVFRRRH